MEQVVWTIPEKDLGEQTKPEEETVHHEVERQWVNEGVRQENDRDL